MFPSIATLKEWKKLYQDPKLIKERKANYTILVTPLNEFAYCDRSLWPLFLASFRIMRMLGREDCTSGMALQICVETRKATENKPICQRHKEVRCT